jgi:adenylate cyclase
VTQEGFKRKLTAILSADVEGYSRLMADDEEATVRSLTTCRKVMTALIQQHNGTVLIYVGRSEESIPWFKRAMRLNPYHPVIWTTFLAAGYYYTQRYSEVVDTIVRKGRLHLGDHWLLAASYAQLGRMDKARAHVNEILKIDPEFKLSKFRTYLQRLYKNETDIEHLIDGLRKAGLPE